MTEKKLSLTQEIVKILRDTTDESSEGYTGAEWIEAAEEISKLPKPTVLQIPWCAWDIEHDEFGQPVMESRYDRLGQRKDLDDDGNEDPDWEPSAKREARYDVLAILVWIPMKREEPKISIEDVQKLMNDMNIREITRKVFAFWGVPLAAIEEQIEAVASGDTEKDEQEAEKSENFTTTPSKSKRKK